MTGRGSRAYAAVLAVALAGEPTAQRALARYDTERWPGGRPVARAARLAGRQLTHPLAIALRGTALRPAPSRVTVRAILRHADGTPPELPSCREPHGA
ncbi:hypothetical protein ACFWN5_04655 [Streptomyces sp. NPDC058430]|uniref:hypothetical protein n=1 Tax=Streptomyces sp. NPDC058430 TaxID=3346495 RepID=UPI003656CD2C